MLTRMIEGNAHLFEGPHDQAFYDSVRELASEMVVKQPHTTNLLSDDEAHAVMVAYAQSNERFRRRYLPQARRPLFPRNALQPTGRSRARRPSSASSCNSKSSGFIANSLTCASSLTCSAANAYSRSPDSRSPNKLSFPRTSGGNTPLEHRVRGSPPGSVN